MKNRIVYSVTLGLFLLQDVSAQQPNLLFVLTDQQSFDMIGYTNEQIITPNLDELAKSGVYFSNAISNCPICTPFRGMLLTGQHPLHNGCWTNDVPLLPDNGTSFAQALNEAGYETGYVGKWHLYGGGDRDVGIPPGKNRHGFNGTFLTNNVTVDFRPEACFYWNDNGEKVFFKDVYDDQPWELEAQTRQAESWLRNQDKENPFALFVSWHPPHDYVGDQCENVEGRQHNYNVEPLDPKLIEPYNSLEVKLRPDLELEGEMLDCKKEQYRNYMAMITACDASVGRLIKILKEKGMYKNTLIVFTSDHGDMIGSHNAYSPKQKPQDYSLRIPLIMSAPDLLPANKKSELLIGAMDMMPTVLGLLDIKVPESAQGKDLAESIINGNDDAVKSLPIFMFVGNGWRGVYTKEWTFSKSVNPNVEKDREVDINVLYNHKYDPGQINNLYDNKAFQKTQEELYDLTNEWLQKYRDEWFSKNDFNAIYERVEWQKNYTQRPVDLLQNQDSNK